MEPKQLAEVIDATHKESVLRHWRVNTQQVATLLVVCEHICKDYLHAAEIHDSFTRDQSLAAFCKTIDMLHVLVALGHLDCRIDSGIESYRLSKRGPI